MSAPPCACEACEAAYGDLRAERAATPPEPTTAERIAALAAASAEAAEHLRLVSIQLGAAVRVIPAQISDLFRKARK